MPCTTIGCPSEVITTGAARITNNQVILVTWLPEIKKNCDDDDDVMATIHCVANFPRL